MVDLRALLVTLAVSFLGCSSSDRAPATSVGEDGATSGASTGNGGSGGGLIGDPPASGGGGAAEGAVYANSQRTLYQLNPVTKQLTTVGDFDCTELSADPNDSQDGMADIALDAAGQMYGVGRTGGGWALVEIDRATAACTVLGAVGTEPPTGLSFVPAGTLDPTGEALVGILVGGGYARFDASTGEVVPIGDLGGLWSSKSADVVSILGGKTYTTATTDDGLQDHLLVLDPVTGSVTQDVGTIGIGPVAGMGFWAGTLYAFGPNGTIHAIDPTDAAAVEVPIPNAPAGLSFWGAGVTTSAPLEPPK